MTPSDLYDPEIPYITDILPLELFPNSEQYSNQTKLLPLKLLGNINTNMTSKYNSIGLNTVINCNSIIAAASSIQSDPVSKFELYY